MRTIKQTLRFWRRLLRWVREYPVSSFGNRCHILCDFLRLRRTKGIIRDEYYQFEFEQRSEEFRRNFLGENEQRFYLDLLNPVKYYTLSRNKYLTHKILSDTGVRKSELYCYYQPEGRIYDSDEIASNVADVCRILGQKGVSQCVIKATENSHGEGVVVVREVEYLEDDCRMHYFNGDSALLSEILTIHPLIFEGLIKQTEQFAGFNSSSVNTVRFMTTLYPSGDVKIVAAFIKIGREGSCVDNAGAGGNVDVCVDVESGRTQYAIRYDGWRNIHEIDLHPDSGAPLNGVVIANWEQIKSEVVKFQQAMPWCKAAGWDVAITDEGPLVIECNDFWDRTGQYFIRRGWRREIRDCYKAWKKTGRTYRFSPFYQDRPPYNENWLKD